MKVHHRLFGDPPAVGFGFNVSSSGFPVGAEWMDCPKGTRINGTEDSDAEGLVVTGQSYEYQSLAFGRVTVIRSLRGSYRHNGSTVGRPHSLTHAVAFEAGNGRLISDECTPAQLMAFDDFISLEAFWRLDKNCLSLPESEWRPPAAKAPAAGTLLPEALQVSLLARYWKAASLRAFAPDGQPLPSVLLCLDGERDGAALIGKAKAFFADEIAAKLPEAVSNIPSLSAGVHNASFTPYDPTALLVLYPADFSGYHDTLFDLRGNVFQPVGTEEQAFIRSVLRREGSPLLDRIYEGYRCIEACPSRAHCPPLADYAVAFNAYVLEHDLYGADADAALTSLRTLTAELTRAHGIPENATAEMLADVERTTFASLTARPFPRAFGGENFAFLFRRAMAAPEDAARSAAVLLTAHQTLRLPPFFMDRLPTFDRADSAAASRAAMLTREILLGAYVEKPPDASELAKLTTGPFVELCLHTPQMKAVLTEFLVEAGKRHPENGLSMLPLSSLYLDGHELLAQSFRFLDSARVDPLPSETECAHMRGLLPFLNAESDALLSRYYADCFIRYDANADAFAYVVAAIGGDTTHALCLILTQPAEKTEEPPTPAQIRSLFAAMLPLAGRRDEVRQAYRQMVGAVLRRSLETGVYRMDWLCEALPLGAGEKPLIAGPEAPEIGIAYYCDFAARQKAVPPDPAFARMRAWLEDPRLTRRFEGELMAAYEQLAQAGEAQARQLLPLFGDVSAAPYLRGLWLCVAREKLVAAWRSAKAYWPPVEAACRELPRGKASQEELRTPDVEAEGLRLLHKHADTLLRPADFEAELRAGESKPAGCFWAGWNAVLCEAFAQRYEDFFVACRSQPDVEQVGALAARLSPPPDHPAGRALRALDGVCGYVDRVHALSLRDADVGADGCVRALGALRGSAVYATAVRLARARIEAELPKLSFVQRFAPALAASFLPGNAFTADAFLGLMLAWSPAAARRPYARQNLPQLQGVSALFRMLDDQHPPLSAALLHAMLTCEPYRSYSAGVRKDKAGTARFFPWTRKRGSPCQPSASLRWWLEGTET